MNFIVWIIFGALAGWVASMIVKTNDSQGAIANIVVGIIGAFIGGYVVQLFGSDGVTGFNLSSFLVAVLGSVILLVLFKAVRKKA
ncbi:GlsB/YeaQ/YmgE family stress response membrane protein [Aeromicrobium sp.]|nr:GlsB/YeaQ/YmgE family stress response membrane protein [Candidatus Saccharibacteria bacterium]